MIRIDNLHKAFGSNVVLKGVDLEVGAGKLCAVLGPNGSGKTTMIKSLLGMVVPDEGRIRVRGEDVIGEWKYRAAIDYLPQIARFPDNLRVSELLEMVQDLRPGASRDEELIERFSLHDHLDARMGKLSGGTRQKVNLVAALMFDSPIVVMDEPTSGLDPVAMIQLKEIMLEERDRGKCVLFSTHIMGFVEEMADELVFLLDGRIRFRGDIADLLATFEETDVERAIARILTTAPIRSQDTEPAWVKS